MKPHIDLIAVGSEVEIELVDRAGNKEKLKFVIVEDKSADFSLGYLSESTPLAKALLGEKAGTILPYLKDDILSIVILKVTRSMNKPPEDTEEKREAMMQKAIREVQDTNAIVFASSFSGKWGDYDPDSIPKKEKEEGSQERSADEVSDDT
jgi:Transcription elongation factor, GreA/GreB, C-term